MASVLEYALSLKTAGFDNPLKDSESELKQFDGTAGRTNSRLGGLTAGFAGATAAISIFAVTTAGALATLNSYAEFDGLVRGLKTLEGTAADTEARIRLLRDVAKVPGLGFEEAVRGDIRLRSVGISANLSEKAMRAFGNAIATVGGGKADLDGVILALGQIESKGSIAAEEINQINERVPQVRAAMKDAFGTADAQALTKAGLTTTQFIEGLVDALGKLPQVTGGARNALDNYDDSWKALKNSASEFAVGLAGGWIQTVTGAVDQARRDLEGLKGLLGIETPGLQGENGQTDAQREQEKAAAARQATDEKAAAESRRVAKANAEFHAALDAEYAAAQAAQAAERVAREKRNGEEIRAAGEAYARAKLTEEEFLSQKLAALQKSGITSPADLNRFAPNSDALAAASKNLAEQAAIQARLTELKKQAAAADKAAAAASAAKAESAADELSAQQEARAIFNSETAILEAKISGNQRLVESLEKQAAIEQLKLDIMRNQGLSETEAAAAAARRIALEERAANPRRGVLDAAASAAAALDRAAARPDRDRGNTDRLAQADLERRAARLDRGNAAADPGRQRREAGDIATAVKNGNDPLLKTVRDIADKFSNLAVS